jgi:hypothetical protein
MNVENFIVIMLVVTLQIIKVIKYFTQLVIGQYVKILNGWKKEKDSVLKIILKV